MALFLGILLFAFILTAVAIVPFIHFLYRLRFTHIGTPIGGGILIIGLVSVLFAVIFPTISHLGVYISSSFSIKEELNVIFFTFISFGLLGLYDDIMKIFGFTKSGFFGLRVRHKFIIQICLAACISLLLYFNLHISIINIPFWGVFNLKWLYIPLATLVIMAFTTAFDLTDGLDGLSCGVLLICLLAFWGLSVAQLDTPLTTFVALWIGSLIAFGYFNVYPARIRLGSAGGLAFGATLAVVGLLIGKIVALLVIGGIFVAELLSSFLPLPITPLHRWLQMMGWPEPKIVLRAWLAAVMLAFFGIWLAQL